MSTATLPARAVPAVRSGERVHRFILIGGYVIAVCFLIALAVYGWDYYTLDIAQRPFSDKHSLLKPSGVIGLKLGFLGLGVFFAIFLYPLRKHWAWLMKQGSTRHWLDIHVLLGLSAPFIIAFHASFKFQGFAGVAFWIMAAVSASGVVGRYLYSQIPRRVNAAELSRKEIQELQAQLSAELADQRLLPQADVQRALRLPSQRTVDRLPIAAAIVYMMLLDVFRVFRVARLRRHALHGAQYLTTLFGLFPTTNRGLERAIATAKEEASLSKRILFLSRSEKVFHLWHVVHKPFSYTFAVLALIHIGVVMMMGYM
jgi:TRAP-type C4-dicarboxylate transport system permease small subunit